MAAGLKRKGTQILYNSSGKMQIQECVEGGLNSGSPIQLSPRDATSEEGSLVPEHETHSITYYDHSHHQSAQHYDQHPINSYESNALLPSSGI